MSKYIFSGSPFSNKYFLWNGEVGLKLDEYLNIEWMELDEDEEDIPDEMKNQEKHLYIRPLSQYVYEIHWKANGVHWLHFGVYRRSNDYDAKISTHRYEICNYKMEVIDFREETRGVWEIFDEREQAYKYFAEMLEIFEEEDRKNLIIE